MSPDRQAEALTSVAFSTHVRGAARDFSSKAEGSQPVINLCGSLHRDTAIQ